MRLLPLLLVFISLTVSAAPPPESHDKLNAAFPDLTFTDPAGKPAKISDYRGKVVMVKLWATWCGVCKAKWPEHQALYDKVGKEKDVEIITLQVFEDPKLGQAWTQQQGYDVPLYANPLIDRAAVKVADNTFYFIQGTPMKFLIDKNGILRKKAVGAGATISETDVRKLL